MFNRIVVGHDHREGGQDALALARLIGKATDAEIVVAGVIPVGMMPAEAEVVWKDDEHDFAEKIRARATAADGEARVFHSHSVPRGISDLAEEIGADLIVVGSSRRGKAGRILAGDIALQVLHGAHCAVAVAPVGFAERDHDALDSIVVGVDGAPEAQAAAAVAAELATAAGAETTLVAVLQPPPVVYGKGGSGGGRAEVEAAIREHLQKHLEDASSAFSPDGQPQTTLLEGDPAETLREAAEPASLLVVGSRGHGPIGRVLLGSTDADLLDSAPCPVLVWPRRAEVPRTSQAKADVTAR